MKVRPALVHDIRGRLSAYGMVLPTRVSTCRQACVATLEAARSTRTELSHELFPHLFDACIEGEQRLVYDDEQLTTMGHTHPECQRLLTIPGLGPLPATALVAAVSDAQPFHHGRPCAAWLG
jgi:transposase